MRVILHIGFAKTGTTAIQHFLDANRARLRERSINYPEAGLLGRAHHVAGRKLLGKAPRRAPLPPGRKPDPRGVFRAMMAETEKAGCAAMLVSTETLAACPPAEVAEVFAGHQVEVIAYVRRQDRYLESKYNQGVKGRKRMVIDLPRFVEQNMPLNYHAYFSRWAGAFGLENVKVRVYDRSLFPGGDVRRDFLGALGVEETGLGLDEGKRNTSLTFPEVHFLRRFNEIPHDDAQRARVKRLLGEYAAAHPQHSSLLAPDERRLILERCLESNRRFAREFLGRDDVFVEIPTDELAAEATLDRTYGEEHFIEMLSFVLPKLLSGVPRGVPAKKRRAGSAAARVPAATDATTPRAPWWRRWLP